MVFQNPADQLFAASVEEDVAFGPRNLGLPEAEVAARVEQSLAAVDVLELRQPPDPPSQLRPAETRLPGGRAGHAARHPAAGRADRGPRPGRRNADDRSACAAQSPAEDHADRRHPLRRPAARAGRSHLRAGRGDACSRKARPARCLPIRSGPPRPACGFRWSPSCSTSFKSSIRSRSMPSR